MKKYLSVVLALLLMLTMALPVAAAENQDDVFSYADLCVHTESMASQYMRVYGMTGTFDLSQPIPIENDSAPYNYITLVFSNGSSMAYLVTSFANGSYSSSFVPGNLPEVDNAYVQQLPVAIFAEGDCCYILCGEQYVQISGGSMCTPAAAVVDEVVCDTVIVLEEVAVQTATMRGSTVEYIIDGFPFVANDEHYDAGEDNPMGICWAACAAAVGRYETGISLSAMAAYNWAKANLSYSGDFPLGTLVNMRNLINRKYILNYSSKSGGFTGSAVWQKVFNDKPIIAGLIAPNAKPNGDHAAHMVVICGAIMSGTEFYYYLMDPNVSSGHVLVYVGVSSADDFTYVTSDYTYTIWNESVYK